MGRPSSAFFRGDGGKVSTSADVAPLRARRPSAELTAAASDQGALLERIPPGSERVERRTGRPDFDCRIVGCVDVETAAESKTLHSDVLSEVAIRRLERCVRPTDWVCMLGGSRIAVCLGDGGHLLAPSALGNRLARAMGDHLAVGTTGHDLQVSIGIGAGPGGASIEELTSAALAAIRSGRGRAGAASAVAAAKTFIAVAHVPPGALGNGHHYGDELSGLAPSGADSSRSTAHGACRLVRRVVLMDPMQGAIIDAGRSLDDKAVSPAAPAAALRVLIVGSEEPEDGFPRFALEAVATVAKRMGAMPTVSPSADPDGVLLDLYVAQPQVAVVVLEPEWIGRYDPSVPSRPWERPAQLVRVLRDAGIPVIALGMGASAAAVATCVEQGAIGVLDSANLPSELASFADTNGARNGNGNGHSSGSGAEYYTGGDPSKGLPSPYSALVALTPSERRVLQHMMEGMAAADIADSLVVSLPTVRSHIRSILRKLNVNSQLAAVAIANGALRSGTVNA